MENAALLLAGRYVLDEEIASGGMATVWRARDEILARQVAVKILHPHLASDDEFLTRFRQEAVAAAGLVHPHIVSIFDTGMDSDGASTTHYIVMEYCSNGTLLHELRRSGSFEPARAAAYLRKICKALDYAHERGVVHRDVKPANVLLASDGTVKVTDFGIAKAADMDGDVSTTGTILGTVAYISPEQAQGDEPGPRSDIYSLGVVAYELLTGAVPFSGDSHVATALMHINQAPDPPSARRAGIPRSLERVVMKALDKDPDGRFASAAEMARALEGAVELPEERVSGAERPTTTIRTTQRAPTRGGPTALLPEIRWAIPLGIVVLVTVALVIALSVVFSGREPGTDDERPSAPNEQRIAVAEVADFDPFGDDASEHPEDVPLVLDGNPSTAWTTQSYNDPFGVLKPGVGLVFDLGDDLEVAEIYIASPTPGYSVELRAANEPGGSPEDYEQVSSEDDVGAEATFTLDEPVTARYWLLWITALPNVTGSAEIGEVRFIGG